MPWRVHGRDKAFYTKGLQSLDSDVGHVAQSVAFMSLINAPRVRFFAASILYAKTTIK